MSGSKEFTLGLVGFNQTERQVLKSMCWLSTSRSPSYRLVTNTDREFAQIMMVDADNHEAIADWENMSLQDDFDQGSIVIWVSSVDIGKNHPRCIKRPIIARRVFHELDQVASRELDYHR